MMNLEEKRIGLQQQLDGIQEQMSALRDQLFSQETSPAAALTSSRPTPQKPVARRAGRAGRGAMKERIVAALEAAGQSGIYVKELAARLGTKPVNVHSWFHSAMKRYSAITKITGGHYRLDGKLDGNNNSENAQSATRPVRSRGVAKAATRKGGRRRSGGAGSRRGELSTRILSEMEGAGARGINVRDLADKLGANHKNIFIWFSTTGKKNAKIEKLGKSQYRLRS